MSRRVASTIATLDRVDFGDLSGPVDQESTEDPVVTASTELMNAHETRMFRNRLSAAASRERKRMYVLELEAKCARLETEIHTLKKEMAAVESSDSGVGDSSRDPTFWSPVDADTFFVVPSEEESDHGPGSLLQMLAEEL